LMSLQLGIVCNLTLRTYLNCVLFNLSNTKISSMGCQRNLHNYYVWYVMSDQWHILNCHIGQYFYSHLVYFSCFGK
jgi:hypothetical protein